MARNSIGNRQRKAGLFIKGGNKAIEDFTNRITGAVGHLVAGTKDGMEEAVDIIAERAMEFTPRDTGDLQNSQETRVYTENVGTTIVGEITYNKNGEAPYAGFVHEIPADHSQMNYPNNPPEAQFKFLEKAFIEKRHEAIRALAKGARKRNGAK